VGTFLIFVLATILIIVFGWVMGIKQGWEEAHRGALIRIPGIFKFIIKYVSPLYLITIFVLWVLFNVFGWNPQTGEFKPTSYVVDLVGGDGVEPNTAARLSFGLIVVMIVFTAVMVYAASRRWETGRKRPEESP
jgi:neurotransmitter:Na+ symporter, NSS family